MCMCMGVLHFLITEGRRDVSGFPRVTINVSIEFGWGGTEPFPDTESVLRI